MKALPLSDTLASLIPETTVHLHCGNEISRCTIKSLRKMNRYFILSCREISDRDRASLFRGATIMVPTASLHVAAAGEYLQDEIIGLAVVATDGDEIGRVVDILDTPAHDVYVIAGGGKEYLVPAVREFIVEVCLDEGRIVVKKMEGLFD